MEFPWGVGAVIVLMFGLVRIGRPRKFEAPEPDLAGMIARAELSPKSQAE